jgi:hypothetical protein
MTSQQQRASGPTSLDSCFAYTASVRAPAQILVQEGVSLEHEPGADDTPANAELQRHFVTPSAARAFQWR